MFRSLAIAINASRSSLGIQTLSETSVILLLRMFGVSPMQVAPLNLV